MANLTLTREWVENIYQLETSDPVMGGPDGIDNRQANIKARALTPPLTAHLARGITLVIQSIR